MVEFAFVLPIVLVLTLGLFDLGRAFVMGIAVQEGARQAARLAAAASYDSTIDDAAVLGRLVASSNPALVGCSAAANMTQTCGGGTWRFTVEVNGASSTLAAARAANTLAGADVRVTAAGAVALLPGFQTGAFGLTLPQIAVQGQAAMVVL
jgi:Flp pilus assembly protein TadG